MQYLIVFGSATQSSTPNDIDVAYHGLARPTVDRIVREWASGRGLSPDLPIEAMGLRPLGHTVALPAVEDSDPHYVLRASFPIVVQRTIARTLSAHLRVQARHGQPLSVAWYAYPGFDPTGRIAFDLLVGPDQEREPDATSGYRAFGAAAIRKALAKRTYGTAEFTASLPAQQREFFTRALSNALTDAERAIANNGAQNGGRPDLLLEFRKDGSVGTAYGPDIVPPGA
jgi:hypothetical protein